MVELLFARLPPKALLVAVRRVARFVTGTSMPSITAEAGVLVSAAVGFLAKICKVVLKGLPASLQSVPPKSEDGELLANDGLYPSRLSYLFREWSGIA